MPKGYESLGQARLHHVATIAKSVIFLRVMPGLGIEPKNRFFFGGTTGGKAINRISIYCSISIFYFENMKTPPAPLPRFRLNLVLDVSRTSLKIKGFLGLPVNGFNLVLRVGVADYAQTPHSVAIASFSKHRNGWRAQVYVNGIRRSKLFGTKTEAKVWATYTEAELRQQRDDARDGVIKFSALLEEYDRRVSVHKKGHDWELKQFVVLKRTKLADMLVHDVGKADISRWKDDRLSEVSGSTVNRQTNLLSHIFTKAIEWGYADTNPVKEVGRPKENEARSRLASDDELEVIQRSSGWDGESPPSSVKQRVFVAFLFSCETAMRQGEVASIRPDKVVGRIVHLTDTKNGSERYVPLSPRAQELLNLVGYDFRLSASQIESNWRILTTDAKVQDLHYHDSRHIGTTKLAQKLEVLDLSKTTGHKDLKQLMRYYHQTPEQLADKLV